MNNFLRVLTSALIDLQMGIIRSVIFSLGFIYQFEFNLVTAFGFAILINIILFFLDKFIFWDIDIEFNAKGEFNFKYPKIVLRFILGTVYALYSAYLMHTIIASEGYTSSISSKDGKDVFFGLIAISLVLEMMFLVGKYHLIKKEKLIRKQFSPYIKMFNDKYMPTSQKAMFKSVLATLENQRTHFNEIRILMEHIMIRMGKDDLKLLPSSAFYSNSSPNLSECIHSISNNKEVFPDHINYSFRFLKNTCSAFSHSNPARPGDFLNEACVYTLLECLDFLKTKVDKKK